MPKSRSSDLQGRQTDQRQDHRNDPKSNNDRRLGPALLLEMMVQRGHEEDPLAGALVPEDLNDDRHRLDDEQAADDHQYDLVLDRDRDGAQRAADGEAADVAHEYRGRGRVE